MKKQQKIFFAWTMLVVLLYNFDFSFIVYQLSDEYNRMEMDESLRDADASQLLVLEIKDAESVIHKGDHEIFYQGKMYDVKKVEMKSGSAIYYCLHDVDEDNLMTVLNTIISKDCDSPFKSSRSNLFGLENHFAKKYFLNESLTVFDSPEYACRFFISNDYFQSVNYSSIFVPPPNV